MLDLDRILEDSHHKPLQPTTRVRFCDDFVDSYNSWEQQDVYEARGTIVTRDPDDSEGSLYAVRWDHLPWAIAVKVPHSILTVSEGEIEVDDQAVIIPPELGVSMMDWVCRTADPVYATASMAVAGMPVKRRVLMGARQVMLELLDDTDEESDSEDLEEVISEVEAILGIDSDEDALEARISIAVEPLRRTGRTYDLDLTDDDDIKLVTEAWNQGVDEDGRVISNRSTASWCDTTLEIRLHPDDVLTFMRRVAALTSDEDSVELTEQMLLSLGIE